jgi:restriction endonuclease Mrr
MTKLSPSYENWLLPFLKILSDGQPHQRGEIIKRIADEMGLTEEQRQARFSTHRNLITVNQAAWCDVYLCKAEFAIKDASNKNNMLHTFRATPLGLKEFKENSHKISSVYLRSFWK